MTIDEAISHAEEVAEHNDNLIRWGCINESVTHNCRECAAEHRQLAEWLLELKELRSELKELRSILDACNILAVDAFAVERLCKELKEAKRLLKMAVEDIHDVLSSQIKITNYTLCEKCKHYLNCNCKDKCITRYNLKQWRFADEALKLIGETNDEP